MHIVNVYANHMVLVHVARSRLFGIGHAEKCTPRSPPCMNVRTAQDFPWRKRAPLSSSVRTLVSDVSSRERGGRGPMSDPPQRRPARHDMHETKFMHEKNGMRRLRRPQRTAASAIAIAAALPSSSNPNFDPQSYSKSWVGGSINVPDVEKSISTTCG